MALSPSRVTLAFGTVVVATTLLGVVAIGVTAARTPGQIALTIVALLVLAGAMLEPYRLVGSA